MARSLRQRSPAALPSGVAVTVAPARAPFCSATLPPAFAPIVRRTIPVIPTSLPVNDISLLLSENRRHVGTEQRGQRDRRPGLPRSDGKRSRVRQSAREGRGREGGCVHDGLCRADAPAPRTEGGSVFVHGVAARAAQVV